MASMERRTSVTSEGRGQCEPPADFSDGHCSYERATLRIDTPFGVVSVKMGCMSLTGRVKQGHPKVNQDSYYLPSELQKIPSFGVFDGHGIHGDEVSRSVAEFSSKQIPEAIENCAAGSTTAPRSESSSSRCAKMVDASEKIASKLEHYAVSEEARERVTRGLSVESTCLDLDESGASSCCCAIADGKLIVTNVGDCRAVLGTVENGKLVAKALSNDHSCSRADESARIKKAGGAIRSNGHKQCVFNPRRGGGLTVTRSYGASCHAEVGVTHEPEVTVHKLSKSDQFLVVASNGVFEQMSNNRVVSITSEAGASKRACKRLTIEASKRWAKQEKTGFREDITMMVVFFSPEGAEDISELMGKRETDRKGLTKVSAWLSALSTSEAGAPMNRIDESWLGKTVMHARRGEGTVIAVDYHSLDAVTGMCKPLKVQFGEEIIRYTEAEALSRFGDTSAMRDSLLASQNPTREVISSLSNTSATSDQSARDTPTFDFTAPDDAQVSSTGGNVSRSTSVTGSLLERYS